MWYFEMGGVYNIKGENVFGRKIFVTPDKIPEIRNRFNNTDVYSTIFCYDNDNQKDSNLYGPMYLDLDYNIESEDDFTKLKEEVVSIVIYLEQNYGIPKSYIKFYFTGKKGFHLIISPVVFGIQPDNKLNVYYKEIAKELNLVTKTGLIDTKIYDNKRLLRMPNSINAKTGLYKVPITFENILKFSFKDMKEYASSPKPNIEVNAKPCEKAINKYKGIKEQINKPKEKKFKQPIKVVDLKEISFPECIVEILNTGACEGNRNNTTIILASAFFQKGASYQDTLDIVSEWNERLNEPSLSDAEISTTVASAYQQVQNGRRYGCTAIRDCDLCVGKKCKIYR